MTYVIYFQAIFLRDVTMTSSPLSSIFGKDVQKLSMMSTCQSTGEITRVHVEECDPHLKDLSP